MRSRTVATAILALVALVLVSCSDGQVERDSEVEDTGYIEGDGVVKLISPGEREQAPDFSGPLLGEDGEFNLADARGDVVVLNVWGSWCPPCRKEAPGLQAVSEELADQGVRFMGVNTRDGQTETAALGYEEEFGITYPSVVDPHGEALLAFRETLPPAAIPSTLVIDRQGRMAARVLGPIGEASLRDMVADIAAEDGGGGSGSSDDNNNDDGSGNNNDGGNNDDDGRGSGDNNDGGNDEGGAGNDGDADGESTSG